MRLRRVIVESPFAAGTREEIEANITYARAAVRDCILRGEAPLASHLLFTQPGVLRDDDPTERSLGMKAGFAWTSFAEAVVVYTDRGLSPGMKAGVTIAKAASIPVEYRRLAGAPEEPHSPATLSLILAAVGIKVTAQQLAFGVQTIADVQAIVEWIGRGADRSAMPESLQKSLLNAKENPTP